MNAQSSHQHRQRYVLVHIFYLADNSRLPFIVLDCQLKDSRQGSDSLWQRSDLSDPGFTLDLALEGIDEIVSHSLLTHHDLLRPLHNEIPSLILRALSHLYPFLSVGFMKPAPVRLDHNRDVREFYFGYFFLVFDNLVSV